MTESVKTPAWPVGARENGIPKVCGLLPTAAWERIATKPMDNAEASDLKKRLAQVILASACTGERDAKRLEQIALRALSRRRSGKQLEAEQC